MIEFEVLPDGDPGDDSNQLLRPDRTRFPEAAAAPDPRSARASPEFEIFVYSPRMEGVHLRFGRVARGGLRWSDRAEDFRTEVLGLVKAQMVKNTVIVPVGAKGGFYCKRLPDPRERLAGRGAGVLPALVSACLKSPTTSSAAWSYLQPMSSDTTVMTLPGGCSGQRTATFSDVANKISVDADFGQGRLARRLGRL